MIEEGYASTAYPPPSAHESERLVVSAVVCDQVPAELLAQVRPEDYAHPLHEDVIRAVEVLRRRQLPVTPVTIVQCLEAGGSRGRDGLVEAVLALRDEVPYVIDLARHVDAVADAADARRLIRALDDVDLDLRLRRITGAEARERLAALAVAPARGRT